MKNTNIEWADHTFNPWEGCTQVSPGCANCYAAARDRRFTGGKHWGTGAPRRRTSAANWNQVRKWNRVAKFAEEGAHWPPSVPYERPRVFCASLADWLDGEVDPQWLSDLLCLIRECPNLNFLLLTKRAGLFRHRMEEVVQLRDIGSLIAELWLQGKTPLRNVWIGATVEDQKHADLRIPELLRIPARVRFLSCEPLLSALEFSNVTRRADCVAMLGKPVLSGIHWVICGGESGAGARPFIVEHADSIRRQCAAVGVAFFMKQLGANPITTNANALDWPEETAFEAAPGGFAAGAGIVCGDRKGGDIAEFPSELQLREFPNPA